MKLVTLFVICNITSIPDSIRDKVGQVIGHTLADPKIIHARQNQEKVLYWQGIECSDKYPVRDWVNELCSYYPSFIIYNITSTKPKFYEKHGGLIGLISLISTIVIGFVFGVL